MGEGSPYSPLSLARSSILLQQIFSQMYRKSLSHLAHFSLTLSSRGFPRMPLLFLKSYQLFCPLACPHLSGLPSQHSFLLPVPPFQVSLLLTVRPLHSYFSHLISNCIRSSVPPGNPFLCPPTHPRTYFSHPFLPRISLPRVLLPQPTIHF